MPEPVRTPLHQPLPHESALGHATGEALYVDDFPPPRGLLHGFVVCSPHARARIRRKDATRALKLPGIGAVLFAADVPGANQVGATRHDEPLLAEDEVFAEGQVVALVLGESVELCRKAAALLEIEYEKLPALLDLREAIARGSFHTDPHVMARGDVARALASAPLRLAGEVETGAQDHFYLETQAALALCEEGGALRVVTSSQNPSEVQAKIAEVLGLTRQLVVCEVPRMGGGFGGKETQAATWAALAALGAHRTRRPVKVRLDRDQDMVQTGKRHPFLTRYDAGFDHDGRLLALDAKVYANGGWSLDLSRSILDRALFHLSSGYWVPALRFEGRVAKTNLASNTAFRGFGGPQGMVAGEIILDRAAERLGIDPALLRRRNYLDAPPHDRTPYDQQVRDSRAERIFDELMVSSSYVRRRGEIETFNTRSPFSKRGLGFQPLQFGISFTHAPLNQAGALVLLYQDGSAQVSHGGTEMGQGLHTKMQAIAAHELGVPLARVRVMTTSTEKVPNTSATAASSGADLNGQAVADACRAIRERIRPVAALLLGIEEAESARLVFEDGFVRAPDGRRLELRKVAQEAWSRQIALSATGFYRTPGIGYDQSRGKGNPFHYFAFGGAVVEIELSALTGETRLVRVDILHDAGDSLAPTIDRGQVEGAFVQGYGWLTSEEVLWDAEGHLLTLSPSTYKVPAIGDAPADFRVKLLEHAPQEGVIGGSKAVGEPPLMLAIAAVTALRHAISSFAAPGQEVELSMPCTPEAVLRSIEATKERAAAALSERASANA